GGTLVYWRRIWENQARYPDTSIAEDALFLRQAIRQGSRLRKQPHARSFVYLRHDSNAWRFPAGTYLQASGWQRADLDAFLPAADLPFYAALSQAAPERLRDGSHIHQRNPLVSCIMPTCNRRAFISQAIRYFLRQDYPHKELIIVDDGSDATGDLVPVDDRIHYIHLSEKSTIGAKRNLACEHCRGEIIAHWDDDDWHAPSRLRYQVEALLRAGVDMCGINTMYFYDTRTGLAWRYSYPAGQRMWLSGSTLCYRRSFWTNHRFENLNVGEDTRFVWKGQPERLTRLADAKFHVGIIHGQNVSPKRTHGPYWQSCQVEEIRQILGDDWPFYQSGQTAMGQPADEV
ncbi:MAG: glycosyltransferase family 2 protein, partial [Ktedonobacteraceae bacterium]|nr:glycosyltransferase family 2 protein [Ktedonobacteraceae bacterium]